MRIENHHAEEEGKTSERSIKVLLSSLFTRKKKKTKERSPTPPHEDSSSMRRDKSNKNMHMSVSEMIMRKLKHSKEKPQDDNHKRLLVVETKKKKGMRISTTKNHLFLQRMTSISQSVKEKQDLSSKNGDSDQRKTIAFGMRISTTKNHFFLERMTSISQKRCQQQQDAQRKIVSLLPTGESAASLSQDSSSSSPSVSESNHFVTFEISQFEAYHHHVEKEEESSHEESVLPQPSILSADEYKLVLEPLFIGYEINPARGMSLCKSGEAKRQTLCNKFEEKDVPIMDEKASVFKYVKAVLDAIDSSWEEMYLKTDSSDQILNPALFSNIPFYDPSRFCAAKHDHELLFDSINELLFEFCREFPQWLSFVEPRTQVFSFSDESIVHEVQKEVYCRLFPLQLAQSVEQIMREDMMDKRRNWWLDVRCEVEWIGFETTEFILNELLEQLILDL